MSRLIVKNLPTYATPARLKEHFSQKGCPEGTVTDVRIPHTHDGTSRRFGFIGYMSEKEALAAKEWFDRTFMDTARLNVQVIDGAKDAPIPRPNKRPRLGPSPHEASTSSPKPEDSKEKKIKSKAKGDSQIDQYMDVMKPRAQKGPAWANDMEPQPVALPSQTFPSTEEDANMRTEDVEDPSAIAEGLSDIEWMKRHMSKQSVIDGEKAFIQSDDEDLVENKASELPPKDLPEELDDVTRTILQTSRLFVRNLAFSCTSADLQELFGQYGEITQVHIPIDSLSGQSKGLAYLTFKRPADAVSAYESLDKKSFQGRLLHILAAVDRRGASGVEDSKGRSLKDDRLAEKRKTAGKEFNWGMLFMNSDAVASSIANRMNVDKTDILNDTESSSNPAVKLALAETHVINETKSFLESQGIVLSAFANTRVKRSDTVILVKNIPYGTTERAIRELFEVHGALARVIIPPSGTIAVVEFEQAHEASNAFRAVAYKRMGNSVVYLEKGPVGMFSGASAPSTTSAIQPNVVRIAEQEQDGDQDADEPSLAAQSTLFVKNLAFATTAERLNQVFRNLPSFSFARVQTKPDPKRPGGTLSMGYGFVGFKDPESARKAMKSMQGFALDGHALSIKFAGRGRDESEEQKASGSRKKSSTTTKMIVKNVPFEASKKDIQDLFGSHAHLKSVRLPKKFDSRSRGFAFLDFLSRREAEHAYETLRHTHLLGRHLVLEWAEEGEDIEALRSKMKAGVGSGDVPSRKRKLVMESDRQEDDVE